MQRKVLGRLLSTQTRISKCLEPICHILDQILTSVPVSLSASSSSEFSQIYAIHSSRQYLSACLSLPVCLCLAGVWRISAWALHMHEFPDRAHIRCITTTCLRIINKCNLKGEKGWYICGKVWLEDNIIYIGEKCLKFLCFTLTWCRKDWTSIWNI